MPKTDRKKLIDKLDRAVSKYVKLRDICCVTCGSYEQLGNGHLFTRNSFSVRFDIRDDGNCHCQCWNCNYEHEYDPYKYTHWYIKNFGQKRYNELHREFAKPTKFLEGDLQEMLDETLLKIKELEE